MRSLELAASAAYESWRGIVLLADPQVEAPTWDKLPDVARAHWLARATFVLALLEPSSARPPADVRERTIDECALALRQEADLRHANGQKEAATWLHSAARVVESLRRGGE